MQVDEDVTTNSYDYLLNMQLWSLSFEKVEELAKEKTVLESQIKTLSNKTPISLWLEDLEVFVDKYSKNLKEFIENENSEYIKVVQKSKVKPMDLGVQFEIGSIEKPLPV